MTPFLVFKKTTGEIACQSLITLDLNEDDAAKQIEALIAPWGTDYAAVKGETDPSLSYVIFVGGEHRVVPRPTIPYSIDKTTLIANGSDFVTITNLHNPCTVVLDDPDPVTETTSHIVTNGGFEFAADVPGLYTIQISQFPFLPMTLEILAT